MNKMFAIVVSGFLMTALAVVLVLANNPAQSAKVAPTAQAGLTPTHISILTLIPTDSSTLIPAITETSIPPFEYVVTPDDTCASIAAAFNISVEAIMDKNKLSPSCILKSGQKLLIPFSAAPVHLFVVANNPPAEFVSEWVNVDLKTANMTRVSIQMKAGRTHINMFGACQPTDCNFQGYLPAPAVDYNYDSKLGILNVVWLFDFETLKQELTITSDGQLKVITQNHYLDNSGRLDFRTVEYFARQ